jgi:peptidoglycan/LPS O-acetylase OafA/YrhL
LLVLALGLAFPLLAWGFLSWLVGFAVRVLERRSSHPSPTVVGSARGHAIGLLALGSMLTLGRWSQSLLFDPLIAIAFGAVLVGLLKDRALAPPPRWLAAYGARASYSLYAIHFPLLVLAAGWVTRSAGRLALGPLGLALIAAFVLSAIAAGWLFSRATEAHTPRIRSWLADRRPIQGELARVTADRRD